MKEFSFALYRLPFDHTVTLVAQTEGLPQTVSSFDGLNGKQGFVVAPFCVSEKQPILLIRPDVVRTCHQDDRDVLAAFFHEIGFEVPDTLMPAADIAHDKGRLEYSRIFMLFHGAVVERMFKKIVLARSAFYPFQSDAHDATDAMCEQANPSCSLLDLFIKACRRYPRMFVSLTVTPLSGVWITASPEMLLSGRESCWKTVAIAGTMPCADNMVQPQDCTSQVQPLDCCESYPHISWSQKNMDEQRIVAAYIRQCLDSFSSEVEEVGPKTVRAANLFHLKSEFMFSLNDTEYIGSLIQDLHPTPAVCGIPKKLAQQFINDNETYPRRFYSGFSGMLNYDCHTDLYVSLRCMSVENGGFRLYAGGGIMPDSDEQQEWLETEAKMQTMRYLFSF